MRKARWIGAACGLTTLTVAVAAWATVTWGGSSTQFDTNAQKPVNATAFQVNSGVWTAWEAVVHNLGSNGTLWYHSGHWGSLFGGRGVGQTGYNPTIAALEPAVQGTTSHVILVYQDQSTPGVLSYQVGTWNYFNPSYITWSAPTPFVFTGYHPAVVSDGGAIYVLYASGTGVSPLYYTAASWSNGSVGSWSTPVQFDSGENVAAAIVPGTYTYLGGSVIAEVHQTSDGVSPLYYSLAQPGVGGALGFTTAQYYDTGLNPTVAASVPQQAAPRCPILLEAHQTQSGTGPLWSRTGDWSGGTGDCQNPNWTAFSWNGDAHNYDQGVSPSLALLPIDPSGNDSASGWEVHQAASGLSTLWWRSFNLSWP